MNPTAYAPPSPPGTAHAAHAVPASSSIADLAGQEPAALVALILGSRGHPAAAESASRLLDRVGFRALPWAPASSWSALLKPAQALRLGAALELGRRICVDENGRRPVICGPEDVAALTADLGTADQEHFVALYLNTRNRLVRRVTVSVGSLNAALVHPREVFAPAIGERVASLVVAHNHPSGETDPSGDDLVLTRRLVDAGELLGIPLVDHVIVGARGWTSLKQTGQM